MKVAKIIGNVLLVACISGTLAGVYVISLAAMHSLSFNPVFQAFFTLAGLVTLLWAVTTLNLKPKR
jgi:hypothetical protein